MTQHPYLESDSLISLKRDLHKETDLKIPIEQDFDLDSIVFTEITSYPISWWIKALDDAIWWQPKWKYTMMYWWPSTGKTTLTLQVAEKNIALWNKVCYLSLEMTKESFVLQNMRTRAGLKPKWVWDSLIPSTQQVEIMRNFVQKLKKLEIKSYAEAPSYESFTEIMNSLIVEWYDMIIVDNLWMIWRQDNLDEMVLYWKVSAFIKNYVDRSDIAVMLVHHTKKWNEASAGVRWYSAYRWNWKIADDCDYVIQLERQYLDNWTTSSRIKVEKDRVWWNNWYTLNLEFHNWEFVWWLF